MKIKCGNCDSIEDYSNVNKIIVCKCCNQKNKIVSSIQYDLLTVQEWVGFSYQKYKDDVLHVTKIDPFELLSAKTKKQLQAGLLNQNEIDKLRTTLYDGFNGNMSMRDISTSLNRRIEFKDRLTLDDNGEFKLNANGEPIISVYKENRAIMIARSEIVRLSNEGALKNYKDNGIEKVRIIAALSDRTCGFCESQNGLIFEINDAPKPPFHSQCRCALAAFIEVK